MSEPAPETVTLDITCKNLSVGEGTARLGFSIAYGENEDDKKMCDRLRLFTGTRLQIKLKVAQDSLPGMESAKPIETVADSKGVSVGRTKLSGGLTFNTGELDVSNLAHFIKKECVLEAQKVGLAASDEDQD